MFFWINAHIGWLCSVFFFGIFFLAGAGSDPNGPPSDESVNAMVQGFVIGVIVAGLAGIPAGVAVMRPRGERKLPFLCFVGMFATGVLIQIGVVTYFAAAN
jgi:hypothetical protein